MHNLEGNERRRSKLQKDVEVSAIKCPSQSKNHELAINLTLKLAEINKMKTKNDEDSNRSSESEQFRV